MQSLGSTSSQPSHDSLSSSDSFLFSDGEHTEDDSSVFLSEGESGEGQPCGASYPLNRGGSSCSPSSQWAQDGFGGPEGLFVLKSDQTHRRPSDASYSALVSSSSGAKMEKQQEEGRATQTEGDHLFAQKCVELQGFVRPLLELLNGLKKGRFDRGLSSFQQSVAMDRIQRIVGVLQKPTIGGRHLHTLLQVEMMLKLWFPQISPRTPSEAPHSTPPHKHRDQLHMPVKKRKLSWSDTDSPTPPPFHCKRFDRGGQGGGPTGGGEESGPARPVISEVERERGATGHRGHAGDSPGDEGEEREQLERQAVCQSELNTTWVHITPILSPSKSCSSHKGSGASKPGVAVRATSPTGCSGPATQDSSISSTTPSSEPHHLLLRQCQPVACQSQPVATETEDCEGGASKGRQGRSHTLPPILKPSSGEKRMRIHCPTLT
ncbi:hypothetical protein GJAV_G00007440 [Gymnothorax javanicus]|nr:hypothetical protein GJAV_G00007440 [Gymnothorax javanicus]